GRAGPSYLGQGVWRRAEHTPDDIESRRPRRHRSPLQYAHEATDDGVSRSGQAAERAGDRWKRFPRHHQAGHRSWYGPGWFEISGEAVRAAQESRPPRLRFIWFIWFLWLL